MFKKINKNRIFEIIQIGQVEDPPSRLFDLMIVGAILTNLFIAIIETYSFMDPYTELLRTIEGFTVVLFTIEYFLRLYTSEYMIPRISKARSVVRFIFSWEGIIDFLSFFPYYLPAFFPVGAVAFRTFRVVRIFRLFRINRYYDSLNVITDVLKSRRRQLAS